MKVKCAQMELKDRHHCCVLRSDLADILSYSAAASLVGGLDEPVFPLANKLLKKLAKTVSFPPSPG